MDSSDHISILELKRLLIEIKDHRPDICLRFRLIGKMWADNFTRISSVTQDGVQLNDSKNGNPIAIPDLRQIIQFEIDHTFKHIRAHFHYTIRPGFETG